MKEKNFIERENFLSSRRDALVHAHYRLGSTMTIEVSTSYYATSYLGSEEDMDCQAQVAALIAEKMTPRHDRRLEWHPTWGAFERFTISAYKRRYRIYRLFLKCFGAAKVVTTSVWHGHRRTLLNPMPPNALSRLSTGMSCNCFT